MPVILFDYHFLLLIELLLLIALFINPPIADLSTKFLLPVLLSTIFLVNLLESAVVICLFSTFNIFSLESVF